MIPTPDQIPEALRGTAPKWWMLPPALAFGPFAVEFKGDVRVAALLREVEPGILGYSDGDREHLFEPVGEPIVRGNVIVFKSTDAPVLFRPLQESDRSAVRLADESGSLIEAVRRAFDW